MAKDKYETLFGKQNDTTTTDYVDQKTPLPRRYGWTIGVLVACLIGSLIIFFTPMNGEQKMTLLSSFSMVAAICLIVYYMGNRKNQKPRD